MKRWGRALSGCSSLMEIRWSPRAYEDLERVFERIQKDNPTAARDVIKKLYDRPARL